MADGNTGNGNVYENHNNNDDGSNDYNGKVDDNDVNKRFPQFLRDIWWAADLLSESLPPKLLARTAIFSSLESSPCPAIFFFRLMLLHLILSIKMEIIHKQIFYFTKDGFHNYNIILKRSYKND